MIGSYLSRILMRAFQPVKSGTHVVARAPSHALVAVGAHQHGWLAHDDLARPAKRRTRACRGVREDNPLVAGKRLAPVGAVRYWFLVRDGSFLLPGALR